MSEQTLAALEEALAAHLQDTYENDHILTDWVMAYATIGEHDDCGHTCHGGGTLISMNCSPMAALGLAQTAVRGVDETLYGDDDDDL